MDCDKALALDPGNAKAIYRRGLAFFELNEYSVALDMFDKLASTNPDNHQAVAQAKRVRAVLEKMPPAPPAPVSTTPEISVVDTPKSPAIVEQTAIETTSSSSAPPKSKAVASPVKAVDTTHVAEAARTKIKTKLKKSKKSDAPKTAYEFENYWRTLKSDMEAFYQFFKLLKPKQIPKLFKASINEDILSSILAVIEKYMISEDPTRAYETMIHIAKINRISTVLLLMGNEDKSVAASILNRLQSNAESLDKNGLQSLAKVFEVNLA